MVSASGGGKDAGAVQRSLNAHGGSPQSQVLQQQVSVNVSDLATEYPTFFRSLPTGFRSYLGVPLVSHNRVEGVLSLYSKAAGHFNAEDERLAASFGVQVAVALENFRLLEELKRLATRDSLTGLYARGHFLSLALAEVERANRYNRPLSVIMLDIDGFKQVNDKLGHGAGDGVLEEVANLCRQSMRETDILGRQGGDELAVILPETAGQEALRLAERLRLLIAGTRVELPQGNVRVTASMGLASTDCNGSSPPDLDALMSQADAALYRAKDSGRNRVCEFKEECLALASSQTS
jgi:diguanylate cyclase (GGDEF)-like protein